jgi:hypothetical protein
MAATTRKPTTAPVLSDPISADLKQTLRALKLGKLLDTLPERLTLARQQNLPHADFLHLVLADEVSRRDTNSAALRARAAGLDPLMRLDNWDSSGRCASTCNSGTNSPACGSSTARTAPCYWDPSGSARHTWPPRSDTSPCVAASACT